ncbi:MAG: hypothetical protein ACXABY_24160, partial [Candidatus Thorarchaeota archaeon]
PVGGWTFTPIDINISGYRDETNGTPASGAIEYYSLTADFSASSKTDNLAMDAIDVIPYGSGLSLTGGDAGSTTGTFQDFIDEDQGLTGNRWGLVREIEGVIYTLGTLTIGGSEPAIFTDSNKTLVFPDGRFTSGFCGLTLDLTNSVTTGIFSSCNFIGRGRTGLSGLPDTRPDYNIRNNNGQGTFDACGFLTFNQMNLESNITLTDCTFLGGQKVFQSGATIGGCTFESATTETGIAYLISDDLGLISSSAFEASNGHGVEVITTGTYSLSATTFTSYGATGTLDAAIFNNSAGEVIINITNQGDTPTIRDGPGATTQVNNAVTLTVTVENSAGVAISGAQCWIAEAGNTGVVYMNKDSNSTGLAQESTNFTGNAPVDIRIRKSSTGDPIDSTRYFPIKTAGTITSNGYTLAAVMSTDNIAN